MSHFQLAMRRAAQIGRDTIAAIAFAAVGIPPAALLTMPQ